MVAHRRRRWVLDDMSPTLLPFFCAPRADFPRTAAPRRLPALDSRAGLRPDSQGERVARPKRVQDIDARRARALTARHRNPADGRPFQRGLLREYRAEA